MKHKGRHISWRCLPLYQKKIVIGAQSRCLSANFELPQTANAEVQDCITNDTVFTVLSGILVRTPIIDSYNVLLHSLFALVSEQAVPG